MFLVSNTRMHILPRLVRKEDGATAVEYGIMVALIAVVIIAAVTLLGGGRCRSSRHHRQHSDSGNGRELHSCAVSPIPLSADWWPDLRVGPPGTLVSSAKGT
jgi:hypothetical protein